MDITMHAANSIMEVKVYPERIFTPLVLEIRTSSDSVEIFTTDEQLSDLFTAIHEHLARSRSHEVPDQQVILNAEYDSANKLPFTDQEE